ncbi:hypothetical protein A3Q56_03284 [Intoshia linei]|uniref:Uncharacterized protein n=1 Tax=Intoshia linei TaxID=1819745 RepID=A0A177B6F1_9BILA|nr:hypothetical protein A3Q56_03284 [Intoshia linei]
MNSMTGVIVDNALDRDENLFPGMGRTSVKKIITASGIRLGKLDDEIKVQDLSVLRHNVNAKVMKLPKDY